MLRRVFIHIYCHAAEKWLGLGKKKKNETEKETPVGKTEGTLIAEGLRETIQYSNAVEMHRVGIQHSKTNQFFW